MTFPEYGTFGVGGVVYPLAAATTNTLLQDSGPAVYYALDYFEACLVTHLGARFVAEAARANLAFNGAAITSIVACKVPYDPAPYLTQDAFPFPLLAVFRVRSKWSNRTISKRHREGEWKVSFILPPLGAAQVEIVQPILDSIGPVLDNRTEQGFDPNINAGALPWALSGIESIEFQDERFGKWDAGGGLTFPVVELTLTVKERVEAVTGAFGPLERVDAHVDVKDADTTTVSDVVQFIADTDP